MAKHALNDDAYTGNDEQIEDLKELVSELQAALIIALPYVEGCKHDPVYKKGVIAKQVKDMRQAIAKAEA